MRRSGPALGKEGTAARLEFDHRQDLWVARMAFPGIEDAYGVVSKYSKKEGIVIKAEVNTPRWKIDPETLVVSGFGQMYPVICTQKGALFADKIDALLKKNRARHLFDIMFMLSQKYPIDERVFKTFGIQEPPLQAVVNRVESFSASELIVNAKTIIRQLVERYRHG